MKNSSVTKHLKDASFDISEMISMVSKNVNCVDVIKKSREAQSKIQAARTLICKRYLKNYTADLFKHNKQEKLKEIMRINKYR